MPIVRLDAIGRVTTDETAAVKVTFDRSISLRKAAWLAHRLGDALAAKAAAHEQEAKRESKAETPKGSVSQPSP